MSECIFCDVINKIIPSKVVFENEEIVAIEDINPQAPTHILVLPRKHIPTVLDMTEEDEKLIGKIMRLAGDLAKEYNIDKKGFRLVLNCNRDGGQTVFHVHLHLVGGRRMSWPPG
jgi:histidine triad (HIT) family protein